MMRLTSRPSLLSALLLAGLLSACSGGLPGRRGGDPTRVSDAPPSAALQPGNNFIVNAVDKVGPAVVRIDTVRRVVNPLGGLFGGGPSIQQQQGQGSGFITRSDGVILTNAHVVEGASEVGVTLPDGRSFRGKVLGSDAVTDVAVVKVAADTVTAGIISAVQRTNAVGEGQRVPYLQTDAAVNPGNSGGPLINERGQVIGINTAIRQAPGAGLSFAIPINLGRQIAAQILESGRASHPYIGVRLQSLTPQLAREVNATNAECRLPETNGVVVVEVMPGSPAARGGLRSCDLIERVGKSAVDNPSEVQVAVDQGRVGEPLSVQVQRGEQQLNLQVKPAELPRQN